MKKEYSNEELEKLETEGTTCKDCEHYEICGLGTDVLCFGFEPRGGCGEEVI